jgi:cysteinyl-tRNA synthetase
VALQLYDTATGAVRPFVPRVPGEVGIYLCGATVQSAPHIGHIRSAVAFDVLRRWLEHTGHRVRFIRNVTDIDDKILARAVDTGEPWWKIAYANEQAFNRAYDALNVLRPTYEPRATGHVPEMIRMIAELIDGGHAYAAADDSGDVYFDVRSWPDYGELTHQRVADMEPAQDADPRGKRDPHDFALWKGHKAGEPVSSAWPTPWGLGRPGWHLECSAMARKYLGPAFDIHAGGLDLRFPHHENEQAQSRAAKDDFAAYWLHNAFVTAGGGKMSKSLGNGLGVPEVLKRVRPAELRYYLGSVGYRSTIEFSEQALEDAAAAYRRIESFLARAAETGGAPELESAALPAEFVSALDDDLGVARAVGVVHDHVREGNRALAAGDLSTSGAAAGAVRAMVAVLGIDPGDFAVTDAVSTGVDAALEVLVAGLLQARAQARAGRDFAAADAARDQLSAAGIVLSDGADGTTWSLATESKGPTSG